MCFLFFLPFMQAKKLINQINKAFKIDNTFFILLLFICVNLYYYNFNLGPSNSGGGIFYHLSNLLFNNSLILFFVFFIFVYLLKYLNLYNFNNIFLFVILVFYNLQFTIYYKYFDPLIFFILLFMIKFDNLKIIERSKKYYLFYLIFLTLNFSKQFLTY